MRPTLALAVELWPTPMANDRKGMHGSKHITLPRPVAAWPTPMAADAHRAGGKHPRGNPNLIGAIRNWATPTSMDSRSSGSLNRGSATLTDQTVRQQWPLAFLASTEDGSPDEASRLSHLVRTILEDGSGSSNPSRVLNPWFVEWLMGWPVGWTDCTRPVMEPCRWRSLWRSYVSAIA